MLYLTPRVEAQWRASFGLILFSWWIDTVRLLLCVLTVFCFYRVCVAFFPALHLVWLQTIQVAVHISWYISGETEVKVCFHPTKKLG